MSESHNDFLRELQATFRAEATEHLQAIESTLVLLEQANPVARDVLVERLLRTLHTLKGAARAVDQTEIERLCHAQESVFSALRGYSAKLDAERCDLLQRACGLAQALLNESSGRLRNQAAALTVRLDALAAELSEAVPAAINSVIDSDTSDTPDREAEEGAMTALAGTGDPDLVRVHASNLDAVRHQAESLLAVELALQHQIAELLTLADDLAEHADMAEHAKHPLARRGGAGGAIPAGAGVGDFALRAHRLVASLRRTRHSFAGIRARLMDATLETALVPFSSALAPLPGLVRQITRSSGKEAVLDMEGGAVQVDRRVLEVARDALVHLVTNAVDHGLETPAQRRAAGKPEAGRIQISVTQLRGDRIALHIADDGNGIDAGALLEVAKQSGRITDAQMAGLDRQQTLRLALLAGVSTRARVTEVSGRGVGLAIVAEKVAAIDGELQIDSESGAGCRFTLLLPVRLTTLRGVVLRTHGARYVLPLAGTETVRGLKEGDIRTVKGRETLLLGERVLPVIRLGQVLGLRRSDHDGSEAFAAVVHAGGHSLALLVDEILAEQEVLPKGLGRQLRRVRYVSGAAQLGDGSLALILAVEDIARHGLQAAGAPLPRETKAEVASILVVEDSITSRLLLKHILEGAGYFVETAADGLEALSKLRHRPYDAVISDVEMPHLDGVALTQRIRANPQTEHLPVVLVTSLQSPHEKERGLQAGADAYVVKGAFDQDSLLKTIRRLT